MESLHKIEKSLADLYKNAPKLSDGSRETLVKIWPWLALIGGILQLLAGLALLSWARSADNLVNSVNRLYGSTVVDSRWSVWIWLSLIILIVEAVLLLMAFPKLQKRQRAGWDLLFLVGLINVVYAVINLFSDYRGGLFGLVWNLLIAAVVFWLLFETRGKYKAGKESKPHA